MFQLGRIVATAAISNEVPKACLFKILSRHGSGDWGDVPDDDVKLNEDSAKNNYGRLLSAYKTSFGKIWVITDDLGTDEVYTTILYPNEY